MTGKNPKKGDVVYLDFDPQAGHEQAGNRPALVISCKAFNDATGFCFVVPITSQIKGYPFEVPIKGTASITGVALADQVKSLDINARNMSVADSVSADCLSKVVQLVQMVLLAPELSI